jgi:hypothetical protein
MVEMHTLFSDYVTVREGATQTLPSIGSSTVLGLFLGAHRDWRCSVYTAREGNGNSPSYYTRRCTRVTEMPPEACSPWDMPSRPGTTNIEAPVYQAYPCPL